MSDPETNVGSVSKPLTMDAETAREYAYLLAGEEGDEEIGGLTCVLNKHTESRRWVSLHELILRDTEGRFWQTRYERGLTEYQDTQPFEHDGDTITFRQVEPREKTTIIYVPVKATASGE